MPEELIVPSFTIQRDYTVALTFNGNQVSVLVTHENRRSARRLVSQSELASGPWVDAVIARLIEDVEQQRPDR